MRLQDAPPRAMDHIAGLSKHWGRYIGCKRWKPRGKKYQRMINDRGTDIEPEKEREREICQKYPKEPKRYKTGGSSWLANAFLCLRVIAYRWHYGQARVISLTPLGGVSCNADVCVRSWLFVCEQNTLYLKKYLTNWFCSWWEAFFWWRNEVRKRVALE